MRTPIYFPTLNALRFYLALCVVLVHSPGVFSDFAPFALSSWDAVTGFFVLSGFLITYLLLEEKRQTGTIDVRRFYGRRAARILPLYYLVLLAGYVILPALFGGAYWGPSSHPLILGPALALLPQLPTAYTNFLAYGNMGPIWSIGVEEIFYLLWPLVVLYARSLPRLCIGIIVVRVAAEVVLAQTGASSGLILFLHLMRVECMAIGALFAWLVIHRHRLLFYVYKRTIQIIALELTVLYILINPPDTILTVRFLTFSVIAGIVIVNVATNPRSLLRIEGLGWRMLGNASYGIYMWHTTVIFIFGRFHVPDGFYQQFSIFAVATGAGLLSYYGFERHFLRWRHPESARPAVALAAAAAD